MRRALLILLAVLIALPLAAVAAAHWFLSGDAVRVRVADAVRRATGRELMIAGPVRLAWSFAPTIDARDVSLSNPPGFSRPDLLHVDRLQAQVALAPLLSRRVEVRRVTLAGPDVLLERDAQGRPNWVLSPPAPPPSAQPSAPSTQRRFEFELGSIEVRDAKVTWRGQEALTFAAPHLAYSPGNGGVSGELLVNGVPLTLSGTAGPIQGAAWPVGVQVAGGGVTMTLSGTSAEAGLGVQSADLSAASALAGRSLPALHDVRAAATLSAAGITGLQLQAGESAFGAVRLQQAALTAPSLTGPVDLHATLLAGQLPIAVAAQAGSAAGLMGGGTAPVTFRVSTDDAVVEGKGTVSVGGAGELSVSGRSVDLARAGALAGVALPAIRDLQIATGLTLSPGSAALHGLHVASAQGDLSGDVAVGFGGKPSVRGSLSAQRLELSALAPQPLPTPASPAPPAPAAPAPPPRADRVIPDTKLPFAALLLADADLQLSIGEAVWRGTALHGVQAHAVLEGGRLRLDPARLQVGSGAVQAQVVADGTAQPPTLSLAASGPGLAAGPALALLGGPAGTTGTIDLDVALRGGGDTLRASAATLDGHAGLAMVDGEIENRWLEDMLAGLMRAASLPLEAGGISKVRCAAIRVDANAGQVKLAALALDTSKLDLDGTGMVDLRDETLDLHLRPQLRLGTALSVPVRVRGTLRAPKVALDPGAIAPGRVGITLGGPPPADTCGPALALARNGKPGPAPAAPAPEPSRPMKPADLLRSLLR